MYNPGQSQARDRKYALDRMHTFTRVVRLVMFGRWKETRVPVGNQDKHIVVH